MSYHFSDDFIAPLQDFKDNHIQYYVTRGTYGENNTIEAVYENITNLGKIFHVEERAAEVLAEYKSRIEAVQNALKGLEPVRTFVFDCQDKAGIMTPGGSSFQNYLL